MGCTKNVATEQAERPTHKESLPMRNALWEFARPLFISPFNFSNSRLFHPGE